MGQLAILHFTEDLFTFSVSSEHVGASMTPGLARHIGLDKKFVLSNMGLVHVWTLWSAFETVQVKCNFGRKLQD
jgi:hypothetical protein